MSPARRAFAALAAIIVTFAMSTPARAVDFYTIFQDGWLGGGVVTGAFSGMDLNNDGHIAKQDFEVFDYSIHFYGNDHVPELFHDMSDLYTFDYTIGSGGFKPSYPLYSFDGVYGYDADDHYIYKGVFENWTATGNEAIVTQVPEPASCALLALALPIILRRSKPSRRADSIDVVPAHG